MSNNFYDKIPFNLNDRTTNLEVNKPSYLPEHHTQFTYLFCIILRIVIGFLVFNKIINNNVLIILCIIILIGFGSKFITNYLNKNSVWKNYLRTTLMYSIILLNTLSNNENKETISGLLIILDSILGQQSRFITTNMSRSSPQ